MGGPEGKVLDLPESPILGAESDDEDYEDADYPDKQLEVILKETSSGEVNLENPDEANRFFDLYIDILDEADNTGCTLIHKIVEREDYYFEKQKPLLKLLLTQCPGILKKQDDEGQTALYTAIRKRKDGVVRFLCETAPGPATEALSVRSPNDNCLHQAIRKDASLAEYLLDKCSKKMLLERDDKRNTPLHVAVDYEICTDTHIRIVGRLLELCEKALEEPGFGGLTPYRYHLQTKDRFEDNTSSTNKPQAWSRPATKSMAKLAKMRNTEINRGDNFENKPMSKLKVKKKLRLDAKKEVPKAKREEISKEIQRMLKLHCMRYLSRNAIIDTLYGLYPTRAFEFDLNGPNSRYTDSCLKSMDFLEFEDILQYVALPKLVVETGNPPERQQKRPRWGSDIPDGKGRKDFQVIFDWLGEGKGVKKIIKVIAEDNVDDDSSIAHSDEVIEKALCRFGVEVWDWRKTDISIDTIATAAEDVRVVHLYSSGNNAVLRGWSDSDGLAVLKKLEKVYLSVKQGLETRDRTQRNIDSFKERLLKHTNNVQVVVEVVQDSRKAYQVPDGDSGKEETVPNRWLECMDQFVQQVAVNFESSREGPKEAIRVAVIDDGIDGADQVLHRNIACGVSFCGRSGSEDLSNTFYVASGGHGTLMATLIRRVCPAVQLYVAKLDEHVGQSGRKQITADSAAKAIIWAIEQNVHIISMSWTVENTGANQKQIKKLEEAIELAAKSDILLFCSANDQGNQKDKCYPANCDSKKIFRIGAATTAGDKWKWVGEGQVDYIFPGEKVLVEPQHSALIQKCKLVSGSSIATAIAAGLAALIMYIVEAENPKNLAAMRSHEQMKAAFTAAGAATGPSPYIMVWDHFSTAPTVKNRKLENEKEIIEWLANKLGPQ
ncbi:MAG: hypothetical protein M1839_007707 [Geoglossum umbratile]|nr:MAG: hypothetical protein M1839_007707 [Geoglossum umbratile]